MFNNSKFNIKENLYTTIEILTHYSSSNYCGYFKINMEMSHFSSRTVPLLKSLCGVTGDYYPPVIHFVSSWGLMKNIKYGIQE